MSDIFISYAREDLHRVEPIIRLFEQRGWSVWWDRNISPGQAFDESIERELRAARCVIVIWSRISVQSSWVRNEASEGRELKTLIPVIVDDGIRLPLEFKNIQAVQLADWNSKSEHPEVNKLLNQVALMLYMNPWTPPIDLIADGDRYIVVMDLPGLSMEHLELIIEETSFLVVKGIQVVTFLGEPDKFMIAERKAGRYYRRIPFPESIEGMLISRDYRDGMLVIFLTHSSEGLERQFWNQ